MRGQTVTLTLNREGFIRAVDANSGPQAPWLKRWLSSF